MINIKRPKCNIPNNKFSPDFLVDIPIVVHKSDIFMKMDIPILILKSDIFMAKLRRKS